VNLHFQVFGDASGVPSAKVLCQSARGADASITTHHEGHRTELYVMTFRETGLQKANSLTSAGRLMALPRDQCM
jgi:hypothetical protein